MEKTAIAIGGGPAGLATALMLAKSGWNNITVLEKRPSADFYEPDKSFLYLIDGRGQKCTDFLGLSDRLAELGVANTDVNFTVIQADGSQNTSKMPVPGSRDRKTAYWLPRSSFMQLLYQEIEHNWRHCIKVLFNMVCLEIDRAIADSDGSEKLKVIAKNNNEGDDQNLTFETDLLLGCDGITSIVRKTLSKWDDSAGSKRFEMRHFPSPSSGLKYKVLTLPPQPPLNRDGSERAIPSTAYAIRGAFRDRDRAVSLGLLPRKNPDEPRTANIITYPDRDIWKLRDGKQVFEFLETAFPQLPIDKILSSEEVARFAESQGGQFPDPQYCPGLFFLLSENEKNTAGVVLMGDAIHCFPPDIGQGVNAALEDVCVLHQAISEAENDLSRALPLYESLRAPDTAALAKLAQIGFPWQYNQNQFRKNLWRVNVILIVLLNRLLPQIFDPPAILMISNYNLSYDEIWRKAQKTTAILYLLISGLAIASWVSIWRF
ncbi:MAG: FAD-dependent oxidoreductase [Limnospira sp.]